jgi:DNA-directed RNA polymerase specialized sigma subunit
MFNSCKKVSRPDWDELVAALQVLTDELKQIAGLRYIERLDYHRIYEVLEIGQAALARAETGAVPRSQSLKSNRAN